MLNGAWELAFPCQFPGEHDAASPGIAGQETRKVAFGALTIGLHAGTHPRLPFWIPWVLSLAGSFVQLLEASESHTVVKGFWAAWQEDAL